ncbi:unnamed protein product [Zymoseptoria tritici ST99CH_1E4]|uniref:Uncharacterized protein n=1 Tax=Zymoseptoria tritici ST99CH_1E4 TaxID=1276532 RepID=A0A2H1FKW0_ZYMTR|nr:unnamed protein product [Zymoseptoria tritici ST99CH_1E4]
MSASTPFVKLADTPILINVQGTQPPTVPIEASKLTTSAALPAHQRSHQRFTLSWPALQRHLRDTFAYDAAAGDEVAYAKAGEGFVATIVRDSKGLDEAFREMRKGRGGVGFWLVRGGWRDPKPIPREEYLAECFFDGEDDQDLSDSEDEHVKKWQKGLVKAEPPISNMTTYK